MKHTTYKLKNGLTVILVPHKTLKSINIEANIKYGSALENPENAGITHFIEHLSLTSTKKWPDKKELSKLIEFNGATYNASTGKETVTYYINLPYTKFDFGIEYIYEILFNSNFNPDDIESERKVILDEISKAENNVDRRAYTFFIKSLSKNNSAYMQETLGTQENVKNFTRQGLISHYKKMHDPSNITIIVSGNFDEKSIKHLVSKYFETIKSEIQRPELPEEGISNKVIKSKSDKKSDLVLFANSFKYKNIKDIPLKEYSIMSTSLKILANTTTSRLYSRLREKEGLLYDIYAETYLYSKFGAINVSFEIEPIKFEQALKIYLEEFKKLLHEGITEQELNHYKEYAYNRALLQFDSFSANKNLLVNAIILDEKIYTAKAVLNSIKKITLPEVNDFIKTHLNLDNSSFILYGKVDSNTTKILKENLTSN